MLLDRPRLRDRVPFSLSGALSPDGALPVAVAEFGRRDLAEAFADAGFKRGAEIGVERGEFAEVLCQSNPGLELLCVDAWKAYRGYREHVTQARLDSFYIDTLLRLRPYGCTVRRAFSVDAAAGVPDGSLDFVFIDANHTFPHVIADIAAWSPKVRPGGVVAGHDFGRGRVGHVREAVTAWTQVYGISPWFVLSGDKSPSWFWVKR